MTGRPKDPTRARRQTGHRRKPGEAPKLVAVPPTLEPAAVPVPPEDLPEGAHPIWIAAVEELAHRGLRTPDLESLRLMSIQAWRAREAAAGIAKFGLVVEGARGLMPNPLIKIERDATTAYLRLAEQFGLTFASRLRLGVVQLTGQSLAQQLDDDLNRP